MKLSKNAGSWLTFVLITVFILAIAGSTEAKEWKKVRIATEGAYAPWNFMDSSGKLSGYEIDLANDLCSRMKVECELIAQDWAGLFPGLNAGKYDLVMARLGLPKNGKRLSAFQISMLINLRSLLY